MVTDAQVRKLMSELKDHGNIGLAALRAGMDRSTARRWRDREQLPSQTKTPRTYKTRADPFDAHWPMLEQMLKDAPELQAKTLFEWLSQQHPDHYSPGQLRTLQRKLKRWRAQHGPDKEVFFPQCHRPGEAAQTDFTHAAELGITIAGEPFVHLIGHFALPFSNWQFPTVCRSESLCALSKTVQDALFELGHVPEVHQTDNSTAATHNLPSGKRDFNERYLELMRHFGITPRTIAVGKKNQNGDIEALNGAFKRRVAQHLLLRGSRDFDAEADYEAFLRDIARQANHARRDKVQLELSVMTPLTVQPRPVFEVVDVRVTSWSTVRIKFNTYSVPARLIGETLRGRVFDERIELYHADALQLVVQRLLGRQGHRIDYRHVIWSLVRKPGAFARYRYRQDLFPTPVFRRAYDVLTADGQTRSAELAYLRVLHLAASTSQDRVEQTVAALLERNERPTLEAVRTLIEPVQIRPPELSIPEPDLSSYNQLLAGVVP